MINDKKIAEKARELEAAHTPFALATVIRCKSATSAKPGSKALITAAGDIYGWIGGGCAQPAVIKTARQALRDGQPQLIRVSPSAEVNQEEGVVDFKSACYSGGSLDIFIEPVMAQPELLLFGSSEVAQSLATLAHFAGFAVTVLSPQAEDADFPWADQVIKSFERGDQGMLSSPMIVVATQGRGDQPALKAALAIDAGYRAFISSARKAEKLKQILVDKGHDREAVDQIVAPAGVAIGAKRPEEIAVSVLAALVAARHDAPVNPARFAQKPSLDSPSNEQAQTEQGDNAEPQAQASCCGNTPAL